MIWTLFWTFLMIGAVSFGGGYAMIPVIDTEVANQGWMTSQEFADIVGIAGMSPGPIATNVAVIVGYKAAGIGGAIAAASGMVLPSLVIIILLAAFFYRIHQHKMVQSAFYGLRPIIAGLVIYAGIRFARVNGMIEAISWEVLTMMLIFLVSLFALIRLKTHPVTVIAISGLVGIAVYT